VRAGASRFGRVSGMFIRRGGLRIQGTRRSKSSESEGAIMINPAIFKAYDVRGVYPDEINGEAAHAIGSATAAHLGASRIAVARDMRRSGPELMAELIHGMVEQASP